MWTRGERTVTTLRKLQFSTPVVDFAINPYPANVENMVSSY
jgi:hypothetical protein